MMKQADFVIVGGGSAGAVIASRLSENSKFNICLLEAGGWGSNILFRAPAGGLLMLRDKPKFNNWAFHTIPQKGLNGRKGYQPRGKALGGSSAINAMIYIRGQKEDYDEWANLGNDGWAWKDVLPFFKNLSAFFSKYFADKTNLWPFSYFEASLSFPPSGCAPAAEYALVDSIKKIKNVFRILNISAI